MRLRDKLTKSNRDCINNTFRTNQKLVYRNWRASKILVVHPPKGPELTKFWSDLWQKPAPINTNAPWMKELQEKYCTNVTPKQYVITAKELQNSLAQMPNNKAPGTDSIVAFWLKNLTCLHKSFLLHLQEIFSGMQQIPDWISTSRTILIPKNQETHLPNNFRPIACQNIMFKAYTSIVNTFLDDHCTSNGIIATEQAGGKKGSWGCTDQLLINRMILDEVRTHKRNLVSMWFDYKKAFD